MIDAEKAAAILAKAEALAGRTLGDRGMMLAETAALPACGWCGREDIPVDMEAAVAALVVSLAEGQENVKSLKRGDTAVTYASDGAALAALACLTPWRRLGRLKEDGV